MKTSLIAALVFFVLLIIALALKEWAGVVFCLIVIALMIGDINDQ